MKARIVERLREMSVHSTQNRLKHNRQLPYYSLNKQDMLRHRKLSSIIAQPDRLERSMVIELKIKFPFKRKACPVLEVKLPSIVC